MRVYGIAETMTLNTAETVSDDNVCKRHSRNYDLEYGRNRSECDHGRNHVFKCDRNHIGE